MNPQVRLLTCPECGEQGIIAAIAAPILLAFALTAVAWPYVSGPLVLCPILLPGLLVTLAPGRALPLVVIAAVVLLIIGTKSGDSLVLVPSALAIAWCIIGVAQSLRCSAFYYGPITGMRTARERERVVVGTSHDGSVVVGQSLWVGVAGATRGQVLLRVHPEVALPADLEESISAERPRQAHADGHWSALEPLDLGMEERETELRGLEPVAVACVRDLSDAAGARHASRIAHVAQHTLAQQPGTQAFEVVTAAIAEGVLSVVTAGTPESALVYGIELKVGRRDDANRAIELSYRYRDIEGCEVLYTPGPTLNELGTRVAIGLLRQPARPTWLSFASPTPAAPPVPGTTVTA